MGLQKRVEDVNKKLDEYDKFTDKKENRPILKHAEAFYIGVIASLFVTMMLLIFEALEIFLKDNCGLTGYPVIAFKFILILIFFSIYTNYLQVTKFKNEKRRKIK